MPFYAVANGRTPGIFLTWDECKTSVNGYKHAVYKKFDTIEAANLFLTSFQHLESKEKENMNIGPVDYYVYTDGACSNNGNICVFGKSSAVAGIGIYFGNNDSRNVSRRIEGKQTNNVAELTAIVEVYPIIEHDILNGVHVAIVSDSEYAIRCVTTYGKKCQNKDSIPNKELVKLAYELYKDISNVRFIHIEAHTGYTDIHSVGNANADRLATAAIRQIL
uniref:Ribonuclease H n=1 Tax=viral metagenome TaxID=1070528 RepID=A0A6C0I419_9ZZZZ